MGARGNGTGRALKDSAARRLARAPVRWSGKLLNPVFHRLECAVLGRGEGALEFHPVFIIGAPRCGSTLLYQLMLDYYDFGYISNLHCRFYGAPSLVERVIAPTRRRRASSYESDHGRVRGWTAPSECGDYWYRFFRRRPQYTPLSATSKESLRNLRRSVRAIGRAMGRPVLFKNLLSGLRIEPILEALPEAKFIVVRRSVLDTAHSILEARMNLYGDYNKWFSVEPPEVDSLREKPPHEQAADQVRLIYALIDRDRRLAPGAFTDVDYEKLCGDTRSVLDSIGSFLLDRGVAVRRRGDVPPSFAPKKGVRIEAELYGRLERYVARSDPGGAGGGRNP